MKWILPLIFLCSSCGYRSLAQKNHRLEVPYIAGDRNGELTGALIKAIARGTSISYAETGEWILQAQIVGLDDDRVGYAYDRDYISGDRINRLISNEGRRTLKVEFTVVDKASGLAVFGPCLLQGEADYDFVNEDTLVDLSFINPEGSRQTVLQYSLGQLDSQEGASSAAYIAACQDLAAKIASSLANLPLLGHDSEDGETSFSRQPQ